MNTIGRFPIYVQLTYTHTESVNNRVGLTGRKTEDETGVGVSTIYYLIEPINYE